MRIRGLWAVVMLGVMAVLWGCGDTANSTPQDEHASDAISSPHDSTTEMDSATPADPADAQGDLDTAESTSSDVMDPVDEDIDTAEPSEPVLPTLVTRAPLTKPEDPLADSSVQSCATYLEERCVAGALSRCDLYDPANEAYVDDPPALLHRAMLFDRWRDLYNSPDGQAIDRDFLSPTLAGTPESDWGSLDNFKCYCGAGDGGIWTGWSVVSAILRYSETGTRAEYERMEEQVRQLLTMWEVTEIPGYLSRYHYLRFEEGAPKTCLLYTSDAADES